MNRAMLDPHIERYLGVLKAGNTDEKYKWEALKTFQDNWDIEAKNFGEMFERCLPGNQNFGICQYRCRVVL